MRAFSYVLVLFAGLSLPLSVLAQGRPAGVATQVVSMQTVSETVSVFGEIVAARQSAVAARIAGIATDVPLRVGDNISQGDVLARLDTELLEIEQSQAEAQIAIAQAGIAVADAQLERAQKALQRAESLRGNSTISEAQLEERASDYSEALGNRQQVNARIRAAEIDIAEVRYRLENATIRAPFDGVVLQVSTEIGQFIAAGSQVATLIDIGAMEVEANVPARLVNALRPDQSVDAKTDANGALSLKLRAVLPTEFAATRTRPVRFEIVGSVASVATGQSVTLDLPVSAPREVLVVPKDALVQAQGGWSVFVNAEGVAQPRTVSIGIALSDGFEVLSGLSDGDEVVVRGNERLRPGQEIAPMGARPPGTGDAAAGGPPAAGPEAKQDDTETGGAQEDAAPKAEDDAAASPAAAATGDAATGTRG